MLTLTHLLDSRKSKMYVTVTVSHTYDMLKIKKTAGYENVCYPIIFAQNILPKRSRTVNTEFLFHVPIRYDVTSNACAVARWTHLSDILMHTRDLIKEKKNQIIL